MRLRRLRIWGVKDTRFIHILVGDKMVLGCFLILEYIGTLIKWLSIIPNL